MIASAYLRVYLPADELSPFPVHVATPVDSVMQSSDVGLWNEPLTEDAFAMQWHDRPFLCPRYPRLRMLEGLLAFHNTYAGTIGSTLVPEQIVRRAALELESLYAENPSARSYILTSPWHVPLRWFVAFDSDQRELVQLGDHSTIRYRNGQRDAMRRLHRAMRVLAEAGFDETVLEPVKSFGEWMADFPSDAVVELDYDSVARLFDETDLVFDESAMHINASIDALEVDDLEQAGEFYALAAGRWAAMQARLFAN
ncbi:MAG: hypothetical protein V3R84_01555 [Acidimicrobiia bacterium]